MKAIIFDLDGVYFKNGTKNFLTNVSSIYHVERAKVEEAYLRSDMIKRFKRGDIESKEFWGWFISELNIEATPEELLKLLVDGYEVNEKAVEVIKKVRKKGVKTVVCSNNYCDRVSVLEREFKFHSDFDYLIFSFSFGVLKPDLLDNVLEVTGFGAGDILLLDDGDSNVKGAEERGFKAVLCEDPDKLELYVGL